MSVLPAAALVAALFLVREPVQHEKAGRDRATVAVDGIEVPRAREAIPALHWSYAESRLRPLARRRLRIARPARVDIRVRKPCRRLRRRTLGWKVRFISFARGRSRKKWRRSDAGTGV